MKRRRLISAIVGIVLVFVMAATAFVGPGVRHTHGGGEQTHSHAGSHGVAGAQDAGATHSHSHGPDGHVHTHSRDSHSHSHQESRTHVTTDDESGRAEIGDAHTHVHMTFLSFEFTLPDFLAEDETRSSDATASNLVSNSTESTAEGSNEETVMITGPFTFKQLVQVLLLPAAPLPDRTVLPDRDLIGRQLSVWGLYVGRLRDAPESPPPEFV